MKFLKRFFALVLAAALCAGLCACGTQTENTGSYNVLKTLGDAQYAAAYRKGDRIGGYITAALRYMEADGLVSQLSRHWFGADMVVLEGSDSDYMSMMDSSKPDKRTLVVGVDPSAAGFSKKISKGVYEGFDIELSAKLCELLGWDVKYQEIAPADVYVELNSGNVDVVFGDFDTLTLADKLDFSPAYMKDSYVVISKTGSGITRFGQLSGGSLAVTKESAEYYVLKANDRLYNKLGEVVLVDSQQAGLDYMNQGNCTAVLVNSALVKYYYINN